MAVTVRTFERVVLEDPKRLWELHRGRLREKPPMTWNHTDITFHLVVLLQNQLDRREYRVHGNGGRLRRSEDSYYLPDVIVVPTALGDPLRGRPDLAELLEEPLPLVVEVWSPSTGGYDVDTKFPKYRARGDHEIWRLHPSERTLTAWRRRPNGGYDELVYQGGVVEIMSLPGVWIDLDALFDA